VPLVSLGKVTVPVAGTPVRATANETTPAANFSCHAFMIQAWSENTGNSYVGNTSTFNSTTGEDTMAILAIPTANTIPVFTATISYASGGLNLADVWVDVEIGGDAVLISAVIG